MTKSAVDPIDDPLLDNAHLDSRDEVRWIPLDIEILKRPRSTTTEISTHSVQELRRTWNAAQVQVIHNGQIIFGRMGDAEVQRRIAALTRGIRLPTIVYLHGCALPRWTGPYSFWRNLGQAGYALIAPDGFARSDKLARCDRTHSNPARRRRELEFTLHNMTRLEWVDKHNLILFGHGEGGEAAARYDGRAFKAIVVTSARCTLRTRVSDLAPLLAVSSVGDPWIQGFGPYCGTASKRILIDGSGHNVLVYPQIRRKITRFIFDHIGKPWT